MAGTLTAAAVALGAMPAEAAVSIGSIIGGTPNGQVVSVPSGTFDFSNFASSGVGLDLAGKAGLRGAGTSATVIEMTPYSSTKAGLVPTSPGSSNPLFLMRATGSPHLSGFTLRGTAQGHLYNGLKISGATNASVSSIRVTGVPGAGYNPPQETEAIVDQRSSYSHYSNISEDGSNLGALGIAANSSNNVSVASSSFINNRYSAGAAFWQTSNVTLTDVVSKYNRTGLNFERCSGTITITRPTILGEANQDLYIGSDQGSAKITIIDPVDSGHLRIRVPATYRGVANKQSRGDIHVIVNGVDRTSSVVTWI